MTNQTIANKLSPIVVPWRITKARPVDGRMEWEATTSKFSRDQQGDLVTPQFYKTAIERFKSKAAPAPFFSVAHYPAHEVCECGATFKSLLEEKCSVCGRDRLQAGITEDMWIDGKQPKAKGYFFDNELGREVYKSCREDIEQKVPYDESVRVSMGFFPDPNGVLIPAPNQRDFISGWVEHFAGTRVPVVPEAALTTKSLSIKTRYDDALAVIKNKPLADRLSSLTGRRLKSEADDLIIKSEDKHLPGKHDQQSHAGITIQNMGVLEKYGVDSTEGVRAVENALQQLREAKKLRLTTNTAWAVGDAITKLSALQDTPSGRSSYSKIFEDAKKSVNYATGMLNGDDATGVPVGGFPAYKSKEIDDRQTGATVESDQDDNEETKSEAAEDEALTDDPLMLEAHAALAQVQKAIAAPGGNKAKILSLAANLVSAIRDYAHTLANDGMPVGDGFSGQPVAPLDVNQMMPPNQPMPPNGQVIDETMDPMNLAPKPEDVVVPLDPNADPNALPNDALPPDLNDPNGPPTTADDLLAEDVAVDPNATNDANEIPPIPDQTDQTQADGGKEVVPAEGERETPLPDKKDAPVDEGVDETATEDPTDETATEQKKDKKKLKFGKKPVAKAVRLTDMMYKHLPGKHDQGTHARKTMRAADALHDTGFGSPKAKKHVQDMIDGFEKMLDLAMPSELSSKIRSSMNDLDNMKILAGDLKGGRVYPLEDMERMRKRAYQTALAFNKWQTNEWIDSGLKKSDIEEVENNSKTSVGERVKEGTRPNVAVKSSSEHPAETFMGTWASGVAAAISNDQLTRQEKLLAVQKSLTEFKAGVLGLIEEATPMTDSDAQAMVKSAVEKEVAKLKAEHDQEVLQLQAKVEALTRSVTQESVQQVIKAVTGKGRLVRKSLSQPSFTPVAPVTAPNGAPVLSGDTSPIRKATAAEVAASSVTAGSPLFR